MTDEAAWALATILIGDAEERKQQSRRLDAIERKLDQLTNIQRQIPIRVSARSVDLPIVGVVR
jgi:hypothetical protein